MLWVFVDLLFFCMICLFFLVCLFVCFYFVFSVGEVGIFQSFSFLMLMWGLFDIDVYCGSVKNRPQNVKQSVIFAYCGNLHLWLENGLRPFGWENHYCFLRGAGINENTNQIQKQPNKINQKHQTTPKHTETPQNTFKLSA